MHPVYRDRPELRTKGGHVLVGTRQLILLHGLYDRPNGTARSGADLARAALPYSEIVRVSRSLSVLRSATPGLHPAWVTRQQQGRRITWTLTPRGRGIVELEVPSWVRGVGPYHGLRELRGRVGIIRPSAPTGQIATVLSGPLGGAIRRVLAAWASINRPQSFNEQLIRQGQLDRLRIFVCEHALERGELPRGLHVVAGAAYNAQSFAVDFDAL